MPIPNTRLGLAVYADSIPTLASIQLYIRAQGCHAEPVFNGTNLQYILARAKPTVLCGQSQLRIQASARRQGQQHVEAEILPSAAAYNSRRL